MQWWLYKKKECASERHQWYHDCNAAYHGWIFYLDSILKSKLPSRRLNKQDWHFCSMIRRCCRKVVSPSIPGYRASISSFRDGKSSLHLNNTVVQHYIKLDWRYTEMLCRLTYTGWHKYLLIFDRLLRSLLSLDDTEEEERTVARSMGITKKLCSRNRNLWIKATTWCICLCYWCQIAKCNCHNCTDMHCLFLSVGPRHRNQNLLIHFLT